MDLLSKRTSLFTYPPPPTNKEYDKNKLCLNCAKLRLALSDSYLAYAEAAYSAENKTNSAQLELGPWLGLAISEFGSNIVKLGI